MDNWWWRYWSAKKGYWLVNWMQLLSISNFSIRKRLFMSIPFTITNINLNFHFHHRHQHYVKSASHQFAVYRLISHSFSYLLFNLHCDNVQFPFNIHTHLSQSYVCHLILFHTFLSYSLCVYSKFILFSSIVCH